MSCRFPGGGDSPEDFWALLEKGVDAVTEVPSSRWNVDDFYAPPPAKLGKMFTRAAAFLDDIDQFDAQFFGITPREANLLDPQQRMLLELSWEALENAGLAPDRLEGSDTGVFIGITGFDYGFLQVPDIDDFTGHAAFGSIHCIASGRLSYFYDFRGPNAAVDTACSSSLSAVHMACQSLRNRECDIALGGGVNAMIVPHIPVALCGWGALSPDGRCKPFSSAANGFGRGEGCGFVVLKRLSDAVEAGDDIVAVIRGTAMTQDGRGVRLSAPNAAAQVAVFRKALADAGIDGGRVGYIEAHGTGTPIGDPIEFGALNEVYGAAPRHDSEPCYLGSVKANIGHQESAAGIAGLLKAVLCMQNNKIPRQIHIDEFNPAINFNGTPFVVPLENVDWPRTDQPRQAAVCSFGLSGTNVHVILEDPPAPVAPKRKPPARAQLLPLSARTLPALQAQVAEFARFLGREGGDGAWLEDICYTASVRRAHHPYRVAVVGSSLQELTGKLEKLGTDALSAVPVGSGLSERVAVVFTGQGSQWFGMAKDLLTAEPVFRKKVQECDRILSGLSGWSVVDELNASEEKSRLGDTEVAQPAIFAIQVGLLALYEAWGVRPDAVIGHSSGEVAAAYAAGALTLEDACAVIFHRSRLMQRATGQGRMAAVGLGEAAAREAIEPFGGRLEIAAVNAPALTTIAGETEAFAELVAQLKAKKVFCKDLGVDYAFHTRQMEPILDELEAALAGISPTEARCTFVSAVTGAEVPGDDLTAGYWRQNVRQPVLFAAAVDELMEDGYRTFLEVGPHPALSTPVTHCARGRSVEVTIVTSLRSGQDAVTNLRRALGELYVAGAEVDLAGLFPRGGRPVRLPNYPWQKRRYWLTDPPTFVEREPVPAAAQAQSESSSPEDELERAKAIIGSFYDAAADSADTDGAFGHLTYIPLPEVVPGYSWIQSYYEPERHPDWSEMVKRAHRQFRQVIFKGIDFSSIRSVMDFGCGYSTDLRNLATEHAHLVGDGYTLSARQAEIGNAKARAAGLANRVHIYQRDSGQVEFPSTYDLVIGFEVAHYIRDKHTLFSNIDRHLNDGGFVVLADFISNTISEIRHEPTNSFFPTVDGWAELLATYKFRVHDCVDVSREMGNWLYDPNSKQNLDEMIARRGDIGGVREHMASYDGLGGLFRKKLATYAMMTIQKDRFLTREEIARINREKLSYRTPYMEVVESRGLESVLKAPAASDALGEAAGWVYEVAWSPVSPLDGGSSNGLAQQTGAWLLFADDKGVGEQAAAVMRSRGLTPVLVHPGTDYRRPAGDARCTVDPANREHFDRLLAELASPGAGTLQGIVHLWSLNARPPLRTTLKSLHEDEVTGPGSLLHLAQALTSHRWEHAPKLWVATRGVHLIGGDGRVAASGGSLWGLGRTLAAEAPGFWGGLVDLDPAASSKTSAGQLVDELLGNAGENQVAIREGKRLAARLRPRRDLVQSGSVTLDADATYLITGGLGGLGLEVARWMVREGARSIVMVQRTPLPARSSWDGLDPASPEAARVAAVKELEAAGAQVRSYAADVADEAEVGRVIGEVHEELPPLRGVVHAAGLPDRTSLSQLDRTRLQQVLAAKISGAWNLHSATLTDPLEFFVMFSSASAILDSPLIGAYAASNAGLDSLAHYRFSEELPALSINWGPWFEVGMVAGAEGTATMGSITNQQGVELLSRLLKSADLPQVAVLPLDVKALTGAKTGRAPLYSELTGQPVRAAEVAKPKSPISQPAAQPAASPARTAGGILQTLQEAEPAARQGILEEYLRERTAQVLEFPASEVDLGQPLTRMGIDSLMAVELRNHVEGDLQVVVELVAFLEGASLRDLAGDILKDQLAGGFESNGSAAVDDRYQRALQQVEQLSDEDVEAMLAKRRDQIS